MLFEVPGKRAEKTTLVTVEVDADGDVKLAANGVTILWLRKAGDILLNYCDEAGLAALGFEVEKSGNVAIRNFSENA